MVAMGCGQERGQKSRLRGSGIGSSKADTHHQSLCVLGEGCHATRLCKRTMKYLCTLQYLHRPRITHRGASTTQSEPMPRWCQPRAQKPAQGEALAVLNKHANHLQAMTHSTPCNARKRSLLCDWGPPCQRMGVIPSQPCPSASHGEDCPRAQ